jgi:putative FmdB family regulatory protein
MPFYTFSCESCGEVKESLVKMGTQEIECKCGGTAKKDLLRSLNFAATGLPNGHITMRKGARQTRKGGADNM